MNEQRTDDCPGTAAFAGAAGLLKPEMTAIKPIYQGFAPLGTCHLQNMANILEAQGLIDARRRICFSWGFSWPKQDTVLYGGNRWIQLANRAYGLDLQRVTCSDWPQTLAFERSLLAANAPFVAEIDAYFVPSPYYNQEHVVHTLIVLAMEDGGMTLLDPGNSPTPTCYPDSVYHSMRMAPCNGRLDPGVLYASRPVCVRNADSTQLIAAFHTALNGYWDQDLKNLDAYIEFVEGTGSIVNVCRVAAERVYLSMFFEMLGEDLPQWASLAEQFSALADRWYLVHMLTLNEGGVRRPQQLRLVRLLRELRSSEAMLATTVLSMLERETDRCLTRTG